MLVYKAFSKKKTLEYFLKALSLDIGKSIQKKSYHQAYKGVTKLNFKKIEIWKKVLKKKGGLLFTPPRNFLKSCVRRGGAIIYPGCKIIVPPPGFYSWEYPVTFFILSFFTESKYPCSKHHLLCESLKIYAEISNISCGTPSSRIPNLFWWLSKNLTDESVLMILIVYDMGCARFWFDDHENRD